MAGVDVIGTILGVLNGLSVFVRIAITVVQLVASLIGLFGQLPTLFV